MHVAVKLGIPIVILPVIILTVGLGVGLGAFFGFDAGEVSNAQKEFFSSVNTALSSITQTVSETSRAVRTVRSLFANSDSVQPYGEFLPFMEGSQGNITGTHSLGWIEHVLDAERSATEARYQSYGQNYASFAIKQPGPGGIGPAPTAPDYYPVTYIYPLAPNLGAIGFNVLAEPTRREAVQQAVRTGKDSLTDRIFLPHTKFQQPGVLYLSPADNGTRITGLGVGVFIVGELFSAGSASLLDTAFLTVFDRGTVASNQTEPTLFTSEHWIERNYSSTNFLWGNRGEYGPDFGSEQELKGTLDLVRRSPFTVAQTIMVGDHAWDIIFIPKGTFVDRFRSAAKWLALFGILLGFVLTAALLDTVIAVLGVIWSVRERFHKIRLQVTEENAERFRRLLNHISKSNEARKRMFDAMPDLVVVVNVEGKILYGNSAFYSVTSLSQDNRVAVISNMIKGQPINFYKSQPDYKEAALSPLIGNEIPISFVAYPLEIDEKSFSGTSSDEERSISVELDSLHAEASVFVMYIRDLRLEQGLRREISNNAEKLRRLLESSEFEQKWRDGSSFRTDLLSFCRKKHNEENILFLQDVEKYRMMSDFDARMKEQDRIANKYILSGKSVHQLNISSALLHAYTEKAKKEIADPTIFDSIYANIKMSVATETYQEYMQEASSVRSSMDK